MRGLVTFSRQMRDLRETVAGEEARKGLKEITKLVRTAARAQAPKSTGELARNIRTYSRVKRGRPYAGVRVPFPYSLRALATEFGTAQMRASPWLGPATRSVNLQMQSRNFLARLIDNAIRRRSQSGA